MSNGNNMTFSVIVNTVGRAKPLRTLLQALEHQSYLHFEVVVVVGPTHDNTLDVLSEYEGRVRVLRCPVINLSRSRNIGLLAARGDVVAFIDDDAVPCQRWLEQYARLFEDPTLDGCGGAVWAAHPKFSLLQFRLGVYSSLAEQIDVRSSWVDNIKHSGLGTQWVARIPGGNAAFRRQGLLDVNGFDEFYEFVAEEADLTLRMVNAGKNIYPVKEAVIYHFPASGPNRVVFTNKGRWWMRSRSRIYLAIKHGQLVGDSAWAITHSSLMSLWVHLVWYGRLFRDREMHLPNLLFMLTKEMLGGLDALIHGLFMPCGIIKREVAEAARSISEPILKFKNDKSMNQSSVDPVSGYIPNISISEPSLRLCLLSSTYPPSQYGGIARLTNLMARGLFELGHTVHVVTRGEREEVSFYDGAYVHKIPNHLERYAQYRNYPNLFATLNYSHNVYEKVQRLKINDGIQIVDSPFWQYEGLVTLKSGIVPVVVRLVTGLRQITAIHKQQVDEFRLMGDLEQSFLEQAHYLLPNTQATYNAMHKVYDLSSANDRFAVVPYGIVSAPEDQVRPFEPKPGDDQRLTVLFVGRLEKRKGILDLFAAIPQVLKRFPNIRFVIAGGDNSQSDGLKLKTVMDYPAYFASRYSKYLPSVQFKGVVSEEALQLLYQSCDLFVAPSLYESFGLVYLEAMNYAKPVIGCLAGGIPEVVDHGVTGTLVEPETPKALADAIVSFLLSPSKMREMGLAGRQQILERFNYLQMARNFERVYRQVIHASSTQSQ